LLAAAVVAGLAATRESWQPPLERFLESDDARKLRERTGELLDSAAREAGERGREVLENAVSRIGDAGATPAAAEATPPPDPGALISEVRASDPAPGGEPGRLSVSLRHPTGGGRLRLWVDDALIFDASLLEIAASPTLVFREAGGGLRGVLPLTPGQRRLRATLERQGASAEASLAAELVPGQSRHLEIEVGGDGRLSLRWR
jgi:hypothetical protein